MAITEKYVTTGAAGGGDGSSGSPWTLAEAASNAVAGDRVNIQSGTYNIASDFTPTGAGSETQPIIWRGYASTIGDGYQGRTSVGALDTSNMPVMALSGTATDWRINTNYHLFECLRFTSSDVTGSAATLNGTDSGLVSCSIDHSGTGGASARSVYLGSNCFAVDCDVDCSTTTADAGIFGSSYNTAVVACRIRCVNGNGVVIGNTNGSVLGSIIYECDNGISIGGIVACRSSIVGNTIVDIATDGIVTPNVDADDLMVIVNNLITDCGGYGYNNLFATGLPRLFYNNRIDRCTSGAINAAGDWPNIEANLTSATQGNEYTSASTDDYSLAATSPAIGNGTFGTNIGYWQNAAGGGSSTLAFISAGSGRFGVQES